MSNSLPHYFKSGTLIGVKGMPDIYTDTLTKYVEKYCQSDNFHNVKKTLSKNIPLAKYKRNVELPYLSKIARVNLKASEKQKIALYKISRKGLIHQEFLELNKLWNQYMLDHVFSTSRCNMVKGCWGQLGSQVYKSDFHGALIKVVQSKCPSLVGLQGIVILDTKKTFKVLGKDNSTRTIPKEHSVFKCQVGRYEINLYGRHICTKSAERCTKKIKNNLITDL